MSRTVLFRIIARLLACLLAALLACGAGAAEIDPQRIEQHTRFLTRLPHRLAGSAEGRRAGDYIVQQLQAAGFERVLEQPFEMTQIHLEEGDCYFEHQGQRVALQPLRPNGLALPATPAEGLDAQTVYLGDGQWEDLRGKTVRDRIAVMAYDCGDRWLRAFAQGARAVIFVGPARRETIGAAWSEAHANLPRFFVEREVAQQHGLLEGQRIRLVSRLSYRRAIGRNIFVVIPAAGTPGTPGTAGASAQEMIGLACEYDTFGPMPFLTPAPRRAANVAGMIEAAAWLQRHPLPRAVLVAFFDSNTYAEQGQMAFQFARLQGGGDGGVIRRMVADREQERQHLQAKLEALVDHVAVVTRRSSHSAAGPEREELLRFVERRYENLREELFNLKLDRQRLEDDIRRAKKAIRDFEEDVAKDADKDRQVPERLLERLANAQARHDRLYEADTRQIQVLEEQKQEMGLLRRGMMESNVPEPVAPLLELLVAQRKVLLEQRLEEIRRELAHFQADLTVADLLGERKLLATAFFDIAPAATPWTVLAPSSTPRMSGGFSPPTGGYNASTYLLPLLTNDAASQWLSDQISAGGERWPNVAELPRSVMDDTPSDSTVAGQASYLLKFSSIGYDWPNLGLTGERDADAAAYATRLAEALDLTARMAGHASLGRARIPARVDSFIFNLPEWQASRGRYSACYVRRYGGGSVEAEDPVAHAVVHIRPRFRGGAGIEHDRSSAKLVTSSVLGTFPLINHGMGDSVVIMSAAKFDPQGQIIAISQLRPEGLRGSAINWNSPGSFTATITNKLCLFEAAPLVLIHPRPSFAEVWDVPGPKVPKIVRGLNDVEYPRANVSMGGTVMAAYVEKLRLYKLLGDRLLLLNNSPEQPAGDGYEPDATVVDIYARAPGDLWRLNESRLDNLRRHGILQNSLEMLHARAENSRAEAQRLASGGETDPGAALAHRTAALGYSGLVYQPVRTVTNDLIKAVVILLLLAIPFSFALERVIVGTPNIYKQIAGYIGIFLSIFLVLYFVHPAFSFASFPVVVLLAFVIIIMSSMVIYIMWSKFEYEVKSFQGIATASHRSTRSNRGTIAAAVALGISTMRRRPLRTLLTAVTIVLLTFTILFFGSFTAEGGLRQIYAGPGQTQRQVEITLSGARSMDEHTVSTLSTLWGDTVRSFTRRFAVGAGGAAIPGRLADGSVFTLAAWATLAPEDLELYPALRQAVSGDLEGMAREGGILLPEHLYEQVKAAGDSTVSFLNRTWVVRGSFNSARLVELRTLDGLPFVPPDKEEMQRQVELQNPRDDEAVKQKMKEMELSAFPLVDATAVALLHLPHGELPAAVQSLVLLPASDAQAARIAAEAATLLGERVAVDAGGSVQRVLYSQQLAFTGFSKVIVPLILGGLIIFSTMLSSVTDREREIFTFSALGLAPTHVAVLFFAEAAVYSVIGGMGGYLFSQVFGKTVEGMARMGWVTAPSMNYSSMNAMFAILIVMLTVLVSTIYPAFKASRSANPGIQRRWRMPAPKGDRFDIQFPFTVSEQDMIGLVSFLEEYFLSHRDRSVGSFAADNVQVRRVDGRFILTAHVWLQPFDQGVSQTFELRTQPSDIEGIDEVLIVMQRSSGSPVIWRRSNAVFIHDIREQFIFWRTIGQEMMDHYHGMTVQRFGLQEAAV